MPRTERALGWLSGQPSQCCAIDRTAYPHIYAAHGRVRPILAREATHGENHFSCGDDQRTIQVHADNGDEKLYTFDRVFPENVQQVGVFEESGVKDMLNKALQGYAVTIFAYGQTGSGKTFTMTGVEMSHDSDERGVIPRSLEYLFTHLSTTQSTAHGSIPTQYTVRAGFVEIYNEQVQDLLNPSLISLPLRWTQQRGFFVDNAFIVHCESLNDCLAVLEEGVRNRTTSAHATNERSSRSHGMMTIYLDSDVLDTTPNRDGMKHGKITFVDLAGSERVKETKTTGDALTETANINKSLLTLGICISALSDAKRKTNHIPYRDSKLTKLLMDSLGGSGLALMIACISPQPLASTETLQTLRYASRAKKIRNRPVIRMDPREQLIIDLTREMSALRTENQQLRALLAPESTSLHPLPVEGGQSQMNKESLKGSAQLRQIWLWYDPTIKINIHVRFVLTGEIVNATALQPLLQSYAIENDTLKYENAELIQSKQRTEREYANIMREAEHLREKLDVLQRKDTTAQPNVDSPRPQWSFMQPPYEGPKLTPDNIQSWSPVSTSPRNIANVLTIQHPPMATNIDPQAIITQKSTNTTPMTTSTPTSKGPLSRSRSKQQITYQSGKSEQQKILPPLAQNRNQTQVIHVNDENRKSATGKDLSVIRDRLRHDVNKLDDEIRKQVSMI